MTREGHRSNFLFIAAAIVLFFAALLALNSFRHREKTEQPDDADRRPPAAASAGEKVRTPGAPAASLGLKSGTQDDRPPNARDGGGSEASGEVAASQADVAAEAAGLPTDPAERLKRVSTAAASSRAGQTTSMLTWVLRNDGNAIVRAEAAKQLGLLRDEAARSDLAAALGDPYPAVIIEAARSLGLMANAEVVDALIRALETNRVRPDGYQESIRIAVVSALAQCGDPRASATLVAELQRDEDVSYENVVVTALGALGDAESVVVLDAHLADLLAMQPQESIGIRARDEAVAIARKALGQINARL